MFRWVVKCYVDWFTCCEFTECKDAPEMVLSCQGVMGNFIKNGKAAFLRGGFGCVWILNVSLFFEFNRSVVWLVPQALEDIERLGCFPEVFKISSISVFAVAYWKLPILA